MLNLEAWTSSGGLTEEQREVAKARFVALNQKARELIAADEAAFDPP